MKTNKLHSIILIGVLVLLVVALFFRSSLNIRVAEATAPTPAWWVDNNGSFSQYDTYQFNNGRTHQLTPYPGYGTDSNIISTSASYDGVAAIGPTGTVGGNIDTFFTTDANASDELEWQCTELVKRFLYLEYGVASIGNTYGYQVVNNYATTYPTKFYKIPNDGTAKLYPKPGDVLSYGTSSPGHTALVQSVGGEGSGSATVTLLEQNASSTGLTYQNFQNWQFQNGIDNDPNNTNTVSGWLTPLKWNDNSPSAGTTHDQIISIGASSTTNAWAAGNESVSCGTWQPVTYHNDGSGWTKYLISYNCANYPYNLNGIVTSSSTNAWAVGGYYPGFGSTLAYHWTGGSSWSLVTSDNPDGTSSTKRNKLLGVALDGSGTPWAVGAYGGNGSQQVPLIEKWNGSKFANQSPALPSGTLNGSLKAISFSSSTNGWAIGGVGWWSGGWHGLRRFEAAHSAYHE